MSLRIPETDGTAPIELAWRLSGPRAGELQKFAALTGRGMRTTSVSHPDAEPRQKESFSFVVSVLLS